MKSERQGYVVMSDNHPATNEKYIAYFSFSFYKKDSIKKFVSGSGKTWEYWKKEYNFRCVKATQTITINEK